MPTVYRTNDYKDFNNEADAQKHANNLAAEQEAHRRRMDAKEQARLDALNRDIGASNAAAQRGDWDRVITEATSNLHNKDRDTFALLHNRAVAYLNKGEHAKALSDCNEVLGHEVQVKETCYLRGLIYENMGKLKEAAIDYHRAAKLGNNKALNALKSLDPKEAARIEELRAAQEAADEKYKSRMDEADRLFSKQKQSFKLLEEMAKEGYRLAQEKLAERYEKGWGVRKDIKKAVEWYRKAAEQEVKYNNAAHSLHSLGYPFIDTYTPQLSQQAPQAAEQKAELATLAAIHEATKEEMAARAEAAKNSPQGKNLAMADKKYQKHYDKFFKLYYDKKKYTEGIKRMEEIANEGYYLAQYFLSVCFYAKVQIPQDIPKAVEWCRKSAEQGYSQAQNDMGNYYRRGDSVPQDYAKAAEWYQKAAIQGHFDANKTLISMRKSGKI